MCGWKMGSLCIVWKPQSPSFIYLTYSFCFGDSNLNLHLPLAFLKMLYDSCQSQFHILCIRAWLLFHGCFQITYGLSTDKCMFSTGTIPVSQNLYEKTMFSILNHEEHDVSIKNLQNKGSVWVPEVNGYICKQGSFWTWVFDPPHVLLQGSIQAKGLVIGHEQA